MKMIPVTSSAIESIGYDPDTRKMAIKFVQGDTYMFCNVPQEVFNAFLNASSKGEYYNKYIKDRYQCPGY